MSVLSKKHSSLIYHQGIYVVIQGKFREFYFGFPVGTLLHVPEQELIDFFIMAQSES